MAMAVKINGYKIFDEQVIVTSLVNAAIDCVYFLTCICFIMSTSSVDRQF